MLWSVFWETLRREWRTTLFWGLGLAAFGLLTTGILPDEEGMKQMVEAFNVVPGFLWQLLGVEDISVLLSPQGFVGLRYFLSASVLICAWAVVSGLNVLVNDETRGIANMMIALPLPRRRIIIEKMLANIPLAVVVAFGGFFGLVFGIVINPNAQMDLAPLVLGTITLLPVALLVISLTVLIGAVLPRRALVVGLAGGFIAVSFILKSVAGMAKSDFSDALAQLSIFTHTDAMSVIRDGFAPVTAILILAIAAGLTYASIMVFERRDLAA